MPPDHMLDYYVLEGAQVDPVAINEQQICDVLPPLLFGMGGLGRVN